MVILIIVVIAIAAALVGCCPGGRAAQLIAGRKVSPPIVNDGEFSLFPTPTPSSLPYEAGNRISLGLYAVIMR